jgi:lipopolysaccharide transport system ATP-binding protein
VVLLSHGALLAQGVPKTIIDLYEGLVAKKTDMSEQEVSVSQGDAVHIPHANDAEDDEELVDASATWTKATTITTNQDAALVDFRMLDESGRRVVHLESEKPLTIAYRIRLNKDFERPAFGLIVRDRTGRSVFETSTYAMRLPDQPMAKGSHALVRFQFDFNLRAGQYSFSVGVADKGFSKSEFEEYSLLMHDVDQIQLYDATDAIYYGGVFNMKPTVSINVLEQS